MASRPSTQDKLIGLVLLIVLISIITLASFVAQKKALGVYDLEDRVKYLETKLYEN